MKFLWLKKYGFKRNLHILIAVGLCVALFFSTMSAYAAPEDEISGEPAASEEAAAEAAIPAEPDTGDDVQTEQGGKLPAEPPSDETDSSNSENENANMSGDSLGADTPAALQPDISSEPANPGGVSQTPSDGALAEGELPADGLLPDEEQTEQQAALGDRRTITSWEWNYDSIEEEYRGDIVGETYLYNILWDEQRQSWVLSLGGLPEGQELNEKFISKYLPKSIIAQVESAEQTELSEDQAASNKRPLILSVNWDYVPLSYPGTPADSSALIGSGDTDASEADGDANTETDVQTETAENAMTEEEKAYYDEVNETLAALGFATPLDMNNLSGAELEVLAQSGLLYQEKSNGMVCYRLTASLPDGYMLGGGLAPVSIDIFLDSAAAQILYVTIYQKQNNDVPATVRPNEPENTVVNLFDYYVISPNNQTYPYNTYINEHGDVGPSTTCPYEEWYRQGINKGRYLMFGTGMFNYGYWNRGGGASNGFGEVNGIFENIVERTLNEDGFPVINTGENGVNSGENLYGEYMDTRTEKDGTITVLIPSSAITDTQEYPAYRRNVSELIQDSALPDKSLEYLFDPDYSFAGMGNGVDDCRDTYTNVTGLFQLDDDGYYRYNMRRNAAVFDEERNVFTLYAAPAVTRTDVAKQAGTAIDSKTGDITGTFPEHFGAGNFFPFNPASGDFFIPIETTGNATTTSQDSNGQFDAWNNETMIDAQSINWLQSDTTYDAAPVGSWCTNYAAGAGSSVRRGTNPNYIYNRRRLMNHYLGMTVETTFQQPYNGLVSTGSDNTSALSTAPMQFRFAGDDDVWVFVDDVLVMDLGGIHSELYGIIDFSTGEVIRGQAYQTNGIPDPDENGNYPNELFVLPDGNLTLDKNEQGAHRLTLKELFEQAGEGDKVRWYNNSFVSNSTHTLKMFFMERGNYDSSCAIGFNLQPLEYEQIKKVDQNGEPVSGVEFELYPAEECAEGDEGALECSNTLEGGTIFVRAMPGEGPRATGITTNGDGLADIATSTAGYDRIPFPFWDYYDGYYRDKQIKYWVLREKTTPDGYRPPPIDIVLEFVPFLGDENDEENRIVINNIRVANRWQTGATASFNAYLTSNYNIYYGDVGSSQDDAITPSNIPISEGDQRNGLMVAVPMFKSLDNGNWEPLYGDNISGFSVMRIADDTTDSWRLSTIKAAIAQAAYSVYNKDNPGFNAEWYFSFDENTERLSASLMELPGRAHRYLMFDPDGDMRITYGMITEKGLKALLGDNYKLSSVRNEQTGEWEDNTADNPDGTADYENYLALGQLLIDRVQAGEDPYEAVTDIAQKLMDIEDGTASGKAFSFSNVYDFSREYRSIVYVPNEERQLRLQKIDQNGNRVNGAVFGVYRDHECSESELIYTGTTSTVDGVPGSIVFTTNPPANGGDGYIPVRWQRDTYYIKEISAPDGYNINTTVISLQVGTYSVYADAGTADDGVSVMASVGQLASTMTEYAQGIIDSTLRDITAIAQTQPTGRYKTDNWQDDILEGTNGVKREMNLHYQLNNRGIDMDYGLHDQDGGEYYLPFFVTDSGYLRTRVVQNLAGVNGTSQYGTNDVITPYNDLGSTRLTNLYSLINWVIVTDPTTEETYTGELRISKTVYGKDATDEDYTRLFKFKVELINPDGSPLEDTYRYFGTDKAGTVKNGDVLPLHHDESITVLGLPAGTQFKITEIGADNPGGDYTAFTDADGFTHIDKFWVVPTAGYVEGSVEKGVAIDSSVLNLTEKPKVIIQKWQSVNDGERTKDLSTVYEGDKVTYYLDVQNLSDTAVLDNTVTDQVPLGLELIEGSVSDGGIIDEKGMITWKIPSIGPGETKTVSFSIIVPKVNAYTTWDNFAVLYSPDLPPGGMESNIEEIEETPGSVPPGTVPPEQAAPTAPGITATGDATDPAPFIAMLISGGGLIAYMIWYRKKVLGI